MADYTTVIEVRKTIGNKGSDEGFTEEVVSQAILNATAYIKSILGKDMAANVDTAQTTNGGAATNTPIEVKAVCNAIAAYYAYIAVYGANNAGVDALKDSFADPLGFSLLDKMAKGEADIGDASIAFVPTSNTSTYSKTIDADDPIDWTQDEDQVNAIGDLR